MRGEPSCRSHIENPRPARGFFAFPLRHRPDLHQLDAARGSASLRPARHGFPPFRWRSSLCFGVTLVKLEVSTMIERPVASVWDFYAVHHVENHPRWNPDIELANTTTEPIGVGTVIRRRSTLSGVPTEATMEITEFEPEKVMRASTRDGPITIDGWALFSARGGHTTQLTMGGEFPGMDDEMKEKIRPLMERSIRNIKALIESET